jgi:hypothetical protein
MTCDCSERCETVRSSDLTTACIASQAPDTIRIRYSERFGSDCDRTSLRESVRDIPTCGSLIGQRHDYSLSASSPRTSLSSSQTGESRHVLMSPFGSGPAASSDRTGWSMTVSLLRHRPVRSQTLRQIGWMADISAGSHLMRFNEG